MYIDNEDFEKWTERLSKKLSDIGKDLKSLINTNEVLVYRSTQSATISSSFTASNRAGTARANRIGSAIWGEEPDIPD